LITPRDAAGFQNISGIEIYSKPEIGTKILKRIGMLV
jgi:hypothetical protein